MEEWLKTIVGGLIGGGVAAFVSWLRYRDERRDQLRTAYTNLFVAVQGIWATMSYVGVQNETLDTSPTGHAAQVKKLISDILGALVRVEFLETSDTCLEKLKALRAAVAAYHRAHTAKGGGRSEEEVRRVRTEADAAVVKARDALMREAKESIDRRWGLDAPV